LCIYRGAADGNGIRGVDRAGFTRIFALDAVGST
jgi:hypothetical protein